MHTHQIRALHAPMFRRGLSGLAGALPLSLSINSIYQTVGSAPTFRLVGAQPGAVIYWSSYKNGQPTGEYNASYNQTVEPNGTVELEGGQWTNDDIGTWTKEVLIQSPDGTNNRAMIQFTVSAPASSTPADAPASGIGSFLSGRINIAGYQIPTVLPIGLAAYWLFIKKR